MKVKSTKSSLATVQTSILRSAVASAQIEGVRVSEIEAQQLLEKVLLNIKKGIK